MTDSEQDDALALHDFEETLAAVRDEIDEAIEAGDFDRAQALIDELAKDLGEDDPEVRFERVGLAWEREGPSAALDLLDVLLREHPDHADAHYVRALACEELDDHEGMIRHFQEVLRLDAESDSRSGLGSEDELDFIERHAEQVLAELPEEFAKLLRDVPIVLEPRPHPELVREGFDPRSFGLFEGLEHAQQDSGLHTAPTRIVLFYANLLADFPEPELLAEEIEITILHEIGHYFGLDEDAVERLGLA